ADTLFKHVGNLTYIRYKNPTLSAVQELSMGVMIPDGNPPFSGTLYFDDIRVADPYNEIGFAYSVDLRTKFADFLDFTIGYEQKTENFKKEIVRNTAPTYTTTTNFDMTGKIYLHKLLPYDWGYNIPVQVSRDQSWGIPRYKANSDILRKDLEDIYLEKEKNLSTSYNADVSFSKSAAKPHWWTKYTLDSTTLSAGASYVERRTPTTIDTTLAYDGTYTYNVQIPRDKIDLKIYKNYYWYFMPRSFDNTVSFAAQNPKNWTFDTIKKEFLPALNSRDTRTLNTSNSINYDIFSDLSSSYRLTTKRDLYLKKYYKDINIGNETEHKQTIDVSFDPNYLPSVFSLSISPRVDFTETRRLLNGTNIVDNEYQFERNGNVNRVTNVDFTIKNSDMFTSLARKWSRLGENKTDTKKINKDNESSSSKDKPKITENDPPKSEVIEKLDDNSSMIKKKDELQRMVDEGMISKEDMYNKLNGAPDKDGKELENFNPKDNSDTGRGKDGRSKDSTPKNLFTYLAMVKNITVSFDNTYYTNYQNLAKRPGFDYRLGIPDAVPKDSLDSVKNENTISLNSGIDLTRSINFTTGYSYSLSTTEANSSSQTERTRFPDVSVSISEFQKWFGIEKVLTSSSLRSGYSYELQNSGDFHWDKPSTVSKTMSFSPLINWNGNWLRNIITQASYSYSKTETTTDRGAYSTVNDKTTDTINGSISYSFTAARGLKLPMIKKRMRLKNELTAGVNFSYVINKDEVKGEGTTIVNTDTTNFSLSPNLTYDFSKNIKGGMDIQYSNEVNKKRDESLRTFASSLWVEIKF
ncbi:MAG: hypothetical protein JXR56_09460, partial [Candidatus Cloacimonetes bacterium]|nr:hypothetical protein [Candidatus Cloacimonadota bacterium]